MPIATVNPATGERLREFSPLSNDELESRVARASAAFRRYRRTPLKERATWLTNAAAILESERQDLARVMTLEMGKPLKAAADEAAKCATACRYYAEHG